MGMAQKGDFDLLGSFVRIIKHREGICWERIDRGERLEVTIQIILTHKQTAGRAMRERKTCRMNEKHTINRSVKSIMTNLKLI